MLRWWSRNSPVTTAQIVWLPRSSGPVLQQPSRKKPGHRVGAAGLQLGTEHIELRHEPQHAVRQSTQRQNGVARGVQEHAERRARQVLVLGCAVGTSTAASPASRSST